MSRLSPFEGFTNYADDALSHKRTIATLLVWCRSMLLAVPGLGEIAAPYVRLEAVSTSSPFLFFKLPTLLPIQRLKLLQMIDEWIEQSLASDDKDVQKGVEAVHSTWGTITLDQRTLQWCAEDKRVGI